MRRFRYRAPEPKSSPTRPRLPAKRITPPDRFSRLVWAASAIAIPPTPESATAAVTSKPSSPSTTSTPIEAIKIQTIVCVGATIDRIPTLECSPRLHAGEGRTGRPGETRTAPRPQRRRGSRPDPEARAGSGTTRGFRAAPRATTVCAKRAARCSSLEMGGVNWLAHRRISPVEMRTVVRVARPAINQAALAGANTPSHCQSSRPKRAHSQKTRGRNVSSRVGPSPS